jgi:Integrase core domain
MGSIGDCFDNAVIESFWSRMQVDLLDRKRWRTRVELANAIFEYLEIFHNCQRRDSALAMLRPVEFEAVHQPRDIGIKSNRPTPRDPGHPKGDEVGTCSADFGSTGSRAPAEPAPACGRAPQSPVLGRALASPPRRRWRNARPSAG